MEMSVSWLNKSCCTCTMKPVKYCNQKWIDVEPFLFHTFVGRTQETLMWNTVFNCIFALHDILSFYCLSFHLTFSFPQKVCLLSGLRFIAVWAANGLVKILKFFILNESKLWRWHFCFHKSKWERNYSSDDNFVSWCPKNSYFTQFFSLFCMCLCIAPLKPCLHFEIAYKTLTSVWEKNNDEQWLLKRSYDGYFDVSMGE